MPLLDKIFGKKEPLAQPATVPMVRSHAQPAPVMAPQPVPEQFFRPVVMAPQAAPAAEEKPIFTKEASEVPVFVKIDKYEEVLTELASIKTNIANFRSAMESFETLRELQSDIISILDGLAKEIERSHAKLDRILVQMQAVEERVKRAAYEERPAAKAPSITELETRIKKLREEITKIEQT